MQTIKQKIMTIDAKELFYFFSKESGEAEKPFYFNTTKRTLFRAVVKQEIMMDECPLLHQFFEVLNKRKKDETELNLCENNDLLYDKLIIIDFGDMFLPIDEENMNEKVIRRKEEQLNNVKNLIEKGLDLHFENYDVHMIPFDKSGNMSRKSRITFIDAAYSQELNERLNLGIDFSKIEVELSKYYSYRGLYLSSSRRVDHKSFKITPETLIIMNDQRMIVKKNGNQVSINGASYERDVLFETAEELSEGSGVWEFKKPETVKIKYNETPFDGEGFISPTFSEYINSALKMKGATSYQVRLPFAKGMLHEVDVHEFINEFSTGGIGETEYWYEDAFGIRRDVKKAHIFLTKSMFKGMDWLKKYAADNNLKDPMEYYCNALNRYNHRLYVSGTNLPYGHTMYTHLSYQVINTLDFTQEQFTRVVNKHCDFIKDPLLFLKGWDETEKESDDLEENELTYYLPNWKKAVLANPTFVNDVYIKEQLNNIQKGLLMKLAMGKVVVEGQMRYLCRDLLPLLVTLLVNPRDIRDLFPRYLFDRFYMPMGKDDDGENKINLDYTKYYAFFRSPHLSRNEQYLLKPFVLASEEDYVQVYNVTYERHRKYLKMYHKYFGHLTGVVMVARGSMVPLSLGGADFDGDLVSVIFDQDIVAAVKAGVYSEDVRVNRKLPIIGIPMTTSKAEIVPEHVPYQHIYDTFSNRIGQISNAAITIGQTEYGSASASEYDSKMPSCAKCTILAGLEIDAAKNGIHPKLDLILNDRIRTCSYLTFINKFKELKSENKFSFNNIRVKKYVQKDNGNKQECIEITASGCDTKAKFIIPEYGTCINQLPILFFEQYTNYQKEKKRKGNVLHNFAYDSEDADKLQIYIDEFKNDVDKVINLHFFYKNILLDKLKKNKNKDFHAVENIEMLIDQIYDEKHASKLQMDGILALRKKLETVISGESFDEIRERINELQWQFQPYNNRSNVLEKIIGNDFKSTMLSEDEQNLLFHFNQQGYKLLWHLIEVVEGPKITAYDKIKESLEETRGKFKIEELTKLEEKLEDEERAYYENNATDVDEKLYNHCLEEIRIIIGTTDLKISTMIAALYDVTESERNGDRRKFFWDAFSWDTLKPFIGKREI